MKRIVFIALSLILIGALFIGSCAEPEEPSPTPTPEPSPAPSPEPSPAPSPEPSPAPSPEPSPEPGPAPMEGEYGGTLRCIAGSIPNVLGYPPEKAPSDNFYMLPVLEHLCEWGDTKGTYIPVLAESWEIDPAALTFIWHLRKGIKFHDGTDWNAEALKWNFQLGLDNNRLTDGAYIDSLEIVDEYTLKMNLNNFDWYALEAWGLVQPISPTAYESSGATEEERIEWARVNAVGTGAYTVDEWQRDDHIRFVKNDNYWQEGLPYFDAIEIRYIPDAMVAAAAMEAGEADMWFAVSTVENILDLQKKGLKMNWGPGMFQCILYNSNDPESIYYDQKIRAAVEYAIDRTTLADMLGQGLYEPLTQMASSTWPGYVEGYDPRPYNPDKARELLAEAGYPDGFKTTLMITEAGTDAGSFIQAYLGEVGIEVELDVADIGRYFGAVFGTGWSDMVYTASGINPSATDIFVHYGPDPMTFRTGNIWKSDKYLALCREAGDPTKYGSVAAAIPKIKEAIRQGGEDAMILPLFRTAEAGIMQTYVYSDYPIIHGIIWTPQDDWMEAH
jgi:peptide/nickel transport system substrate-binding protein